MATIVISNTFSDANLPPGITLAYLGECILMVKPLLDGNGEPVQNPTGAQLKAHLELLERQHFHALIIRGHKMKQEAAATSAPTIGQTFI